MSTPDQPPFESLHRLIAQAVATHEAVAARLGINPTDLRCLGLIGHEPGLTPTRLAELTGLTTGAVTGVLDRLERAGFVRREPDPEDRRRLTVRVNPERMGELAEYFQPLIARAVELSADWTPKARRDLMRYLEGFADVLGVEAERLRAAARGGMVGDQYLAPVGDATHGRLLLATGAPRLTLGAAAFGQQVRVVAETAATRLRLVAGAESDQMLQASFEGPPPDVRGGDGTVTMRYRRRILDTRSRAVLAALNPAIPWSIEIDGGITDLEGDARGLRLASLEVHDGANHVDLRLPPPEGTSRFALHRGASSVVLRRPAGTAAMLRIFGGASRVRFDDRRFEPVDGEMRLESSGYDRSADRYEIEIAGGVSDLRVTAG
jgi:DNA-binding MarR family transcriptional regulator